MESGRRPHHRIAKNEAIGRKLVDTFIDEDFKRSVQTVLDAAAAGHQTENFEFPLYKKDGQRSTYS